MSGSPFDKVSLLVVLTVNYSFVLSLLSTTVSSSIISSQYPGMSGGALKTKQNKRRMIFTSFL